MADIAIEKHYTISHGPFAVMDLACTAALKSQIAKAFDDVEEIELSFTFTYRSETAEIWLSAYPDATFRSNESARRGTFTCVYPDGGTKVSDIVVTFEPGPPASGKHALPRPDEGLSIGSTSAFGSAILD